MPKRTKQQQHYPWPLGRRVTMLRRLTPDELEREHWQGQCVVALELDDGSVLFPSCDTEGNGPGALFGYNENGSVHVFAPPTSRATTTSRKETANA